MGLVTAFPVGIAPSRSNIAKAGQDKGLLKLDCRQNATVASHLESGRIRKIAVDARNLLEGLIRASARDFG